MKQASNCLTIDRWCSPLGPIERGKPVVVSGRGIGAVIEKNLDSLHEASFGSVVQRRGSPTVVVLPGEALVLDARVVTQERGDVKRIILSSLVPGAREPYPPARPVDALCPSAARGFLMCPLCYTTNAILIGSNCRPIRTHLPSQSSRKYPAG